MSKAKVKVTVKPTRGSNGTLLARVPVTIAPNDHPSGKRLYQTKAQLITRIGTGRPQTTRLKRAR